MQNFQVVDISAWQEKLNWQKLNANNIQGVIIKIGEYTHLDEMFISHVNNAIFFPRYNHITKMKYCSLRYFCYLSFIIRIF